MKLAFSKPTQSEEERQMLFTSFHAYGYEGLQLKQSQYHEYAEHPHVFLAQWGKQSSRLASGLITVGRLDEAGRASLRTIFRFARAVGSERVIFCHAQPRQALTDEEIKGFARSLSALGREAQDCGIALSLHHHYDQPVMYQHDFEVFFEHISEHSVGLTLDTAHLVKSGIEDIAGIIRTYHQVLDNVHLKDFVHGDFMVLGTGQIDFVPVFTALREVGYTGWLCADEESDSDLLSSIQECAQFLLAHNAHHDRDS
jgi:inosose dehydratase